MALTLKELEPVFTLMGEQEERIVKKLDEAIKTIKEQNSRIGKCEDNILERNVFCSDVQIEKERKIVQNRWIIGTLLVSCGLLSGLFYKTKQHQEVPIELIYNKTDSTYAIPNMYFRRYGDNKYMEVNKFYIDIKEDKK